jgi:lactoylglutathione lyase
MPHSVEMPAPVNGAITRAPSTSSCSRSMAVSRSGAIMYAFPIRFCQAMQGGHTMRYLHTMLRVRNLDQALDFYCKQLGLKEVRRRVDDKNRYTLVFLAASEDEGRVEESKRNGRDAPLVELTYNWDSEDYGEARYFGHLAYEVDDIYGLCDKLMKAGVTINRPPRDGVMAFVRSPDKHSVELLQKGTPLPPKEPWASMPNTGKW